MNYLPTTTPTYPISLPHTTPPYPTLPPYHTLSNPTPPQPHPTTYHYPLPHTTTPPHTYHFLGFKPCSINLLAHITLPYQFSLISNYIKYLYFKSPTIISFNNSFKILHRAHHYTIQSSYRYFPLATFQLFIRKL